MKITKEKLKQIIKEEFKAIQQEGDDAFSVGPLENPLSTVEPEPERKRPVGGYATDDGIYGAMTVLAPLVDWYPDAKIAMDALQNLMKELHP